VSQHTFWRHTPLSSGVALGAVAFSLAANSQLSSPAMPTQLGCSGSNVRDTSGQYCCEGTLGAMLSDGNKQYVLSNNHVLGLFGRGSVGDEISQPGLMDSACKPGRTVAKLTLSLPLIATSNSEQIDAAIAEVVAGQLDPSGSIANEGVPGALIVAPSRNLRVTKMGRSTGVTTGVITETVLNANIDYSGPCEPDGPSIPLTNLILIQGDNGKDFSAAGDSGSLVMTLTNHNPVGLLIAGNDQHQSVAHPIAGVLNSLSSALGTRLSIVSSQPTRFTASAQSGGAFSPEFKTLLDAKDQLWARLHSLSSIVGIGVSPRSDKPGRFQIVVYVERGKLSSLGGQQFLGFTIPPKPIPMNFNGHFVRFIETDRFKAF